MISGADSGDALGAFVEAIVRRTIDAAIRDGRIKPAAAAPVVKRALTASEVAERYGVPERTLADWRANSKGPAWTKPGKWVLYRVEDLEAFFVSQRVRTLESDQLAGPAR